MWQNNQPGDEPGTFGPKPFSFLAGYMYEFRWTTNKKTLLLSIESWLFDGDPYNGLS